MCVITAGGAGDEGSVLESASPLLSLLWAEDFDGDQSYSSLSQPRQRSHVGCNGLMISSCPVARGLRCFGVLLEGIAAIHHELTARAAIDGLTGLSAAGRSMLLLCTSLSS